MSKGDGIRKRGNNTWEVRVSLGWDERTSRYRRTQATVHGTRADAERKRRELLVALDKGVFVDPSRQSLAEYLEDWLKFCEQKRLSPSTVEGYSGSCHRYIIPALGSLPLQKVTPAHIERFYTDTLEKGSGRGPVSERTVLHAHRVLHAALRRAVRLRLLAANPCEAVEPPRPKKSEMKALSEAEVVSMMSLLEAEGDELLYGVVVTAVMTGLRRGEILGLKWTDIDLAGGTLTVRRSLLKISKEKEPILKEPKTARSRRTISLPRRAVDELRTHKTKQARERLMCGAGYRDEDLVFAGPDGSPFDPTKVSQRFLAFRREHGIEARFHDLRHTHATLMLKAGEPVKVVADRLGHATAMLTLDTYAHVLPGMDAGAADRFGQMLEAAAVGS